MQTEEEKRSLQTEGNGHKSPQMLLLSNAADLFLSKLLKHNFEQFSVRQINNKNEDIIHWGWCKEMFTGRDASCHFPASKRRPTHAESVIIKHRQTIWPL